MRATENRRNLNIALPTLDRTRTGLNKDQVNFKTHTLRFHNMQYTMQVRDEGEQNHIGDFRHDAFRDVSDFGIRGIPRRYPTC